MREEAGRAARFEGPHRVRIESSEVGEPAANQVRVKLEGCGVCGSNLPVWQGRPWFSYPFDPGVPGHEGWGRVSAVGSRVHEFTPGDRVAVLSGNAYADYDFATPEQLVRLPPQLEGKPFPGEPLACAVNIFHRSGISAGQLVAIVGIGFIGAALTALASLAGARVVAISRRPFALEMAQRCGADAVVKFDDPTRTLREARRLSADGGYERVIECVGSQGALDLASELCATRGRLIIAGYHQDGPRHVDLQQWNWRGLDVINAHERDPAVYKRAMQEAVELVVSGKLKPGLLFTHSSPLEDISAAFTALEQRPHGFLKALVLCA
jgi:2-desacetyl-2-hydroxyethyl bacteriochlorophyllide A dehydrogenase